MVAVVDSGVDASNPHLSGQLAGGTDLVSDGKGNGGYADSDGHGTALAGIIAARKIDGSGVEGLAPAARILSVRVFAGTAQDTVNAGHGPSIARLAAGIEYAADSHAQIINVSLSTPENAPELASAVRYATAHGSLVVAAAGNRDSTDSIGSNSHDGPRYPADDPGALGVAAIDGSGVVTHASIHGPQVALSAPGQNILTTSAAGGDCVYGANSPATSFATAYVSAAAALVASAYPDETPAQWAYRLEATALRANPDARDDQSGWGLVQPYSALTLQPGPGIRGPASPFAGANAAQGAPPHEVARTEHVEHRPNANAAAVLIALSAAIVSAVALGVIGALLVSRKNRRPEFPEAARADRPRRPLLGPATVPPDD